VQVVIRVSLSVWKSEGRRFPHGCKEWDRYETVLPGTGKSQHDIQEFEITNKSMQLELT